jgi:hypothetical protein
MVILPTLGRQIVRYHSAKESSLEVIVQFVYFSDHSWRSYEFFLLWSNP